MIFTLYERVFITLENNIIPKGQVSNINPINCFPTITLLSICMRIMRSNYYKFLELGEWKMLKNKRPYKYGEIWILQVMIKWLIHLIWSIAYVNSEMLDIFGLKQGRFIQPSFTDCHTYMWPQRCLRTGSNFKR